MRNAATGCSFQPLLDDRFVIACGTQHPLAGRRGVRWATVATQRWLMSPVGSSARTAPCAAAAPTASWCAPTA
jgi:DNA-binding transcriptional LysR family regulator